MEAKAEVKVCAGPLFDRIRTALWNCVLIAGPSHGCEVSANRRLLFRPKIHDDLRIVSPLADLSHCSTGLQLESGSNSVIAVAISVVVFPKSFWRTTPSWLIMKVMTPELPYSAG